MNTQKPSTILIEITPKQLRVLILMLQLLVKVDDPGTYGKLLKHLRTEASRYQAVKRRQLSMKSSLGED